MQKGVFVAAPITFLWGENKQRLAIFKSKQLQQLLLSSGERMKRYIKWLLIGISLLIAGIIVLFYIDAQKNDEPIVQTIREATGATPDINITKEIEQEFVKPVQTQIIQKKNQALYEQNNDMIGWITIKNTAIDYPVVQYSDNEYYMDKDFCGEESKSGTIYLDYKSDINGIRSGNNFVLYGHHMSDGSMFADLMQYKNEAFFRDNSIIEFNTLYQDYQWEIFSVYVTSISFNYIDTKFLSEESWMNFLDSCKSKSMYENDIDPEAGDIILTLSTCTYEFENARFVVHARLIRDIVN